MLSLIGPSRILIYILPLKARLGNKLVWLGIKKTKIQFNVTLSLKTKYLV